MARNKDFLADIGAERSPQKKRVHKAPKKPAPVKAGAKTAAFRWGGFNSFYLRMRQFTPQIGLSCLIAVLVGVAGINALFLQSGKHPAPLFVSAIHDRAQTASIETANEIVLDRSERQVRRDLIVQELQRHLKVRGYYDSNVDGVIGARTRAAIGLYQRTFGEPVTNDASRALLEHIRLSTPEPSYHADARRRVATREEKKIAALPDTVTAQGDIIDDSERIKQVQRALVQLGFKAVTADGLVGPITREAVKKFKQQRGLRADGAITTVLFNELVKLKLL